LSVIGSPKKILPPPRATGYTARIVGVTLTILGSGSAGNCALLETPQVRVLVDAGLSARQVTERLASIGRAVTEIDAIVLTHEHADHAQALTVFCRRHAIPIYANRLTANEVARGLPVKYGAWKIFETGQTFEVGDLRVETFTVPHDAQDPVGFVFRSNGSSIGFLTDLGHVTRVVTDRVRNVNALVVESNHDLRMLRDDPYRPWALKQRIGSRHGHLSNDAAANFARDVVSENLRRVCLAHLSRDCNRPELAQRAVVSALESVGARGVTVEVALQEKVMPSFVV
jgi:phosphoribosyl 1,2-cyclic phosphodiesterase